MISNDLHDVRVEVRNGRISTFEIDSVDLMKSADRANLIVDLDGSVKLVVEYPVNSADVFGAVDASLVPSIDLSLIRRVINDFLNAIDPTDLENSALSSAGWGSQSMGQLVVEYMRGKVDAIHQ